MDKNELKKAMEYTVYMMIGSYFDKAKYINAYQETNMYICYACLKAKYQVELESACEEYFLEEIKPNLNKAFLNSAVKVRRIETANKKAEVEFWNDKANLRIIINVERRGEIPKFDYHIIEKHKKSKYSSRRYEAA